MRLDVAGEIARYVRSFYELVGNRRKFARAPISGAVYLTTRGHAIDTTSLCSLVDVSPRGIGVDCPELVAFDAFVHVHSLESGPGRWARVRHCQPLGDVYRVGLEFVEEQETRRS